VADQSGDHERETAEFLGELAGKGKMVLLKPDYPNTCNAKNLGIGRARGDILLFLDDDVTIDREFIPAHLSRYSDKLTGAVTGKLIVQNPEIDQNIVFKNTPSLKGFLKAVFFFFFRRRAAYAGPFGVYADFSGDKRRPADTGIGCNLSFRKEVFAKAGLFDVNFTGNAVREETDMCLRVRKAGYAVVYEPLAKLIHYMDNSGGSRNFGDKSYWFTFFKNQCYFYLKNFKSPKFLVRLVLFFDLLRCARGGLPALALFNRAHIEARQLLENGAPS
jgi:GT2 family glycosyltransferase